ncbi:MAG: hypothetical protein ACRCW2_17175 [Cellulosilyticaceae bacterium]
MKTVLISSLKNVESWLFERFLKQIETLDCDGLKVSYFWATEKEEIVPFFLSTKNDYLFFIDAHMLCHPKLLKHLIALEMGCVKVGVEIGHLFGRPKVYPLDECSLTERLHIHEGGTTLCDVYYPVFPVFEYTDLEAFDRYYQKWQLREVQPKKLTLSMMIRQQDEKYIGKTMNELKEYLDFAVVLIEDEASLEVVKKYFKGIPYEVNFIPRELQDERSRRIFQWEQTIKTKPEWMLFLDGDEQFEEEGGQYLPYMIREEEVWVYNFRSYCMWDMKHYREDNMWQTHLIYTPFMVRYDPLFDYHFDNEGGVARVPHNILEQPYKSLTIRIKKWGFADEEDRKALYKAKLLGDEGKDYMAIVHYVSMLDNTPHLVVWE